MAFITPSQNDPFTIDPEAARSLGTDLTEAYKAADPFPHTVIDDFLPREVIDYCLAHFPEKLDADGMAFDRDQERYKQSFNPDFLEPKLRSLFYTFNSRPFVKVVENITGIKGLIPDPYFLGGGFHEIGRGGHLSVHADFNHHKLMDLERRVNVLIYLNDDWRDEYGGQLELWNTDMTERRKSVLPLANRCVMFSTTGDSFHGNPNPISHPEGKTRKSIALYYYTATWDEQKVEKTTQFKPRPGSGDKTDWKVKSDEMLTEFLPPVLARRAKKVAARLIR